GGRVAVRARTLAWGGRRPGRGRAGRIGIAGHRDGAAAPLRIHPLQPDCGWRARRARALHARLLGAFVQAGRARPQGEACRARPAQAAGSALEACDLRAAPLATGRARSGFRDHLGSERRRLRADAGRILLCEIRRPGSGRGRARRRRLCARLRHPRPLLRDAADAARPAKPLTRPRQQDYDPSTTRSLGEVGMRPFITVMLATARTPFAMAPSARAQGGADAAIYIVSYVDVVPAAKSQAAALLRQLATTSRKEPGVMGFDVLQRTDPSHQFVILEASTDQQAIDAHVGGAPSKQFREKLAAHLISPVDERLCIATLIGPVQPARGGGVHVVTHVDVPGNSRDQAYAALK